MKEKLNLFYLLFIAFFILCAQQTKAQDTLPNFTVQTTGNGLALISWTNPFGNLVQVTVQRSYDSLKRFTSIYATPSPNLPVNGLSDKLIKDLKTYYRIFYVMEGGSYFFTESKTAELVENSPVVIVDSKREKLDETLQEIAIKKSEKKKEPVVTYDPNKPIYIKESDTAAFTIILTKDFGRYRDSIMIKTKDTLLQTGADTIFIRPYNPPFTKKASEFVYINRDGFVEIRLDDAEIKKYELTIFNDDESPLIDLKKIRDTLLILDKTNFYKAGWYKYTLKENGRIKEKGKIYLPSDFNP